MALKDRVSHKFVNYSAFVLFWLTYSYYSQFVYKEAHFYIYLSFLNANIKICF